MSQTHWSLTLQFECQILTQLCRAMSVDESWLLWSMDNLVIAQNKPDQSSNSSFFLNFSETTSSEDQKSNLGTLCQLNQQCQCKSMKSFKQVANSSKISKWIHHQTGLWVYCNRKNMFLEKVKIRDRANKERVKILEISHWKDLIDVRTNSS